MELDADDLNRLCEDSTVAEVRAPYGGQHDLRGFRKLRVWHVAIDLLSECYRLAHHFPSSEQFGLTSQLRRSVVSVSANIAEGWGRNSRPEFARFIDISIGSLCEVESHLAGAIRLGYVTEQQTAGAEQLAFNAGTMLHKLRIRLRS